MKFAKKVLSIFLVLTIISGLSIGFTSCSNSKKLLTVGEYLTELTDKFGIYSYQSKEPYIKNVSAKNKYFDAVQMAYEWNIIDESTVLDLDSVIDKGFTANTLVKAVGLVDTSEMNYDEIAQYAADKGYIAFDYRGRTDNAREINAQEARNSMDAAFKIWTNRDYGEGKATVNWKDDVTDFSSLSTGDIYELEDGKIGVSRDVYDSLVSGSGSSSDNTGNSTGTTNGTATLEKGDSFVLPATDTETMTVHTADDVQITDDYVIISSSKASDEQIESLLEDFESQGSTDVDFTKAIITDGQGNPVNVPSTSQDMDNTGTPEVGFIGSDVSDDTNTSVAESGGIDFSVDDLGIKGHFSKDYVSFSVDGTLSETQNGNMEIHKSYEIKNIHIDHDIENKWISIQKAYVNVDYTTVDTTSLDFSYSKKGIFAPEHTNGNGKFPSNFSRAILKDSEAKGAKNIKICNIEVAGSPILSLRLVVEIHISINGNITLTVTTDNQKGFDYQKGNGIRFINETERNSELTAHGKAELTAYVGVGAFAFGTSLNIIGGGFEVGVGVIVDVVARMADSENRLYDTVEMPSSNSDIAEVICKNLNGVKYIHDKYGPVTLRSDVCSDLKSYWKVWIGLDSGSEVAQILSDIGIELSKEWGGPENGIIDELCFHFEDGKRVSACTRTYSNVEASTTDAPTTEEYTGTNIIKIENYFVNVTPGSTDSIKIENTPDGYSRSDITYESSNNDIATVDSSGRVTGKTEGSAIITIKTKDNKFSATCNVIVTETNTGGGN